MDRHPNAYRIALRLSETPVWSGSGWMVLCPVHDDTTPSLHFSDGEDGTLLYYCHARCHHADIRQALFHLGVDLRRPARNTGHNALPRPRLRQPAGNAGPFNPDLPGQFLHATLGPPVAVWAYPWLHDPRLCIQAIARYETPDGKTYRPWQLAHADHGGPPRLRCARLADPQPLYHGHRIPPAATVLFVEGEKAADATRALMKPFPWIAVTTNPGGTGRADCVSLALLRGKNIVLAYDDDDSGRLANRNLAERLADYGLPRPAILALRHELPNPSGRERAPAWDPGDETGVLRAGMVEEWAATLPPHHPLCPATASLPPG